MTPRALEAERRHIDRQQEQRNASLRADFAFGMTPRKRTSSQSSSAPSTATTAACSQGSTAETVFSCSEALEELRPLDPEVALGTSFFSVPQTLAALELKEQQKHPGTLQSGSALGEVEEKRTHDDTPVDLRDIDVGSTIFAAGFVHRAARFDDFRRDVEYRKTNLGETSSEAQTSVRRESVDTLPRPAESLLTRPAEGLLQSLPVEPSSPSPSQALPVEPSSGRRPEAKRASWTSSAVPEAEDIVVSVSPRSAAVLASQADKPSAPESLCEEDIASTSAVPATVSRREWGRGTIPDRRNFHIQAIEQRAAELHVCRQANGPAAGTAASDLGPRCQGRTRWRCKGWRTHQPQSRERQQTQGNRKNGTEKIRCLPCRFRRPRNNGISVDEQKNAEVLSSSTPQSSAGEKTRLGRFLGVLGGFFENICLRASRICSPSPTKGL